MANKFLLDSSAWLEYLAGTESGNKIKDIVEKEDIATCILSLAEISDKFNKENEKIENFLSFIKKSRILNISISTCTEAGKLKAERRKVKKDFGLIDAIIYLTAKENSYILITKDDDFKDMKDVILMEK